MGGFFPYNEPTGPEGYLGPDDPQNQLPSEGSFSELMQGSSPSPTPEGAGANIDLSHGTDTQTHGGGLWHALTKIAPALILGAGAVGAMKNRGSTFHPWAQALEGIGHGYAGRLLQKSKDEHSRDIKNQSTMVDLATQYLKEIPSGLDQTQFKDLIQKRSDFAQALVDGKFPKIAKTGTEFTNAFLVNKDALETWKEQQGLARKGEQDISGLQHAAEVTGQYPDPNMTADLIKDPRARAEYIHAQNLLRQGQLIQTPWGTMTAKEHQAFLQRVVPAQVHEHGVEYRVNNPPPGHGAPRIDPKVQLQLKADHDVTMTAGNMNNNRSRSGEPLLTPKEVEAIRMATYARYGIPYKSQTLSPPPGATSQGGLPATGFNIVNRQ